MVIPTNRPLIRKNHPDRVFLTAKEKYDAIIKEVKDCVANKQPVLLGTASIDTSEYLSKMLTKDKIKHEVLNAKQHEREAKIIAQAGRPGAITIATNMAGRGTDIILGGSLDDELSELKKPTKAEIEKRIQAWKERNKMVIEAGGLHVIGGERNESRRIDNQLRGRSGRQGDPGSSRYYVSLEDSLMRIFAADRMRALMKRLGMGQGDAIEHAWINKAIENAQRKVEGFHFDVRKQLLDFDNVANDQRKVIYEQRSELMELNDISKTITALREDVVNDVIDRYMPPQSMEDEWDISGLEKYLKAEFALDIPLQKMIKEDESLHEETIRELIFEKLNDIYKEKERMASPEALRQFEKTVMLQVFWIGHLGA